MTILVYNEDMVETISVTEFKAKCLALLDRIDQEGGTLTVTKRGRPVATVGPVKNRVWKSLKGVLEGKARIVGDIVNLDTSDLREVVNDPDRFFPKKKK
jgi:prevent-host-death family protein